MKLVGLIYFDWTGTMESLFDGCDGRSFLRHAKTQATRSPPQGDKEKGED